MEKFRDENSVPTRSANNHQGIPMEGVKFASGTANTSHRRALQDIENIIRAPHQHLTVSKRGLLDKPAAVDAKNQAGHRPITRRFAATLASQPTCSQLEQKRVATSTARNADDALHAPTDMVSDDQPLPMLSEMEEMASSELKEIEMEDIEEETAPDIDSCDAGNSLAVVEYVDEIYSFYRSTEDLSCVCPNYMSNQLDINEKMRGILIDWLIEVHYKLELLDETLFLTVNIIDRFLARQNVVRKKLQLVGVTAMLLACKYEEVNVPMVDDLILICDRAYTRPEILEMERMVVNTVQFNMSVPTPYCFMRRFLKAAQTDRKLELLSSFFVELCLVEYKMLRFCPSLLAAAAVYTAQCTMTGLKSWNKCCELHTKYSEDQLMECSRRMVELHRRAAQGKLTGVHRKYSTFRYGCTARSGPALFLLDAKSLEL